MDKVRFLLTIISLAVVVGPFVWEVMVYRDNLSGLIVPPEVVSFMGVTGENDVFSGVEFEAPRVVGSSFDVNSRTVEVILNVTNPFDVDLSLEVLNGTLVCSEHDFVLGFVGVNGAVEFRGKQSTVFSVVGSWVPDVLTHVGSSHVGEDEVGIDLIDVNVEVNGVMVSLGERIHLGDFPLVQVIGGYA